MASHGPTYMANHEPTIMANQNNQKFSAKMQSRERNQNFRSHSIRGYCLSRIKEDFNTKCFVMNNEEKLFQQKLSVKTLFLLKKTRAKKFQVRMFYHLQNLVWRVFVHGGFWGGGYMSGVFLSCHHLG